MKKYKCTTCNGDPCYLYFEHSSVTPIVCPFNGLNKNCNWAEYNVKDDKEEELMTKTFTSREIARIIEGLYRLEEFDENAIEDLVCKILENFKIGG